MVEIKDVNNPNYKENPLWQYEKNLSKKKGYHGVIYMYINKFNGKKYIGQTYAPYKRHKRHINTALNIKSNEYNSKFHWALRKYGINNFQYCILIELETDNFETLKEQLNKHEISFIAQYNTTQNGYNIQTGGTTFALVNKYKTRDVCQYTVDGEYLKTYHTLADAARTVHGTANVIKKACLNAHIVYGYRWAYNHEFVHKKSTGIYQYDINGNYLAEFKTAQEASKQINMHVSGICNAIKDKHRLFGGYYWRREKMDKLPFEDFPNAVAQYDLNGKFVTWYHNVNEAVKAIGASGSSAICAAINRNNAYRNYLWRRELKEQIDPAENRFINKATIVAIFPDNRIVQYDTIKDAALETGVSKGAVNRSIRHLKTHSTNNIKFIRANEYFQ